MDKQQAADAKYPFHPEDDVKDREEIRGLRDAHMRGWETREAQAPECGDCKCISAEECKKRRTSPIDAVAQAAAITDILEDAFSNATHKTLGGYGADMTDCREIIAESIPKILALFNPSGAAPKPPNVSLLALLDKIYNIIQPETPAQIREIKKFIRETLDKYNSLPPAPPASWPVANKLAKAMDNVVKLCKGKLDTKFFGCAMADCEAALDDYRKGENTTPQAPAGPVWVKCSTRMPIHPGDPNNHWRLDGFHKVAGNFFEEDGQLVFGVNGNGLFKDYEIKHNKFDRIEWLDESAPAKLVIPLTEDDGRDWNT